MPLGIDLTRPLRSRAEQVALVEAVRDAPAAESETNYLEWKGSLDLTDKTALAKIAAAVLGFANRMPDVAARFLGGCAYMLVGVEPGALAGVGAIDAAKLEARIAVYVGANVQWRPDYVEVGGTTVLIVTVEAPRWGEPGHPVRKTFTDGERLLLRDGAILVRRHASTVQASGDEMDALARRAARRADNDLVVDVRLADAAPLGRVDLAEETIARFADGRERVMLAALDRTSAFGLLTSSSPLATFGEYRTEEKYRDEVAEYRAKLMDALPRVLLARSVLHNVGRLRLAVINETERTFTGVRVELLLHGAFDVCTWEEEVEDETELPRSPTPFGQARAGVRGFDVDFVKPLSGLRPMKPLWTPDAEIIDGRTRIVFSDKEVRAEGLSELPDIWLLLDQDAPDELTVEWQATAKEATKRLRGTIAVPVLRELVGPARLLEDPPEAEYVDA